MADPVLHVRGIRHRGGAQGNREELAMATARAVARREMP